MDTQLKYSAKTIGNWGKQATNRQAEEIMVCIKPVETAKIIDRQYKDKINKIINKQFVSYKKWQLKVS